MRRWIPAAWAALAAFGLLGAAAAQEAASLAYTPKVGEKVRYKTSFSTSVMGLEISQSLTSSESVTEVKPNGDYTLVTTAESTKLTVGGMEQEGTLPPPVTESRTKHGRLLALKGTMDAGFFPPGIDHLMSGLMQPILSDRAVKVGETWKQEVPNAAVEGNKVTVTTTLVAREKLDGQDAWKITQSAIAATDKADGKMTVELTAWLRASDGRIMKMNGSVKDLPTTQFGALSSTVALELLK